MLTLFTSCVSYSLKIDANKSIYFWEPLEVKVQLINLSVNRKTILAPPQGQVFIRKQGEKDWRRVGADIPQGVAMHNDNFTSIIKPGDTITTHLLVRPVQFYSNGQKKPYNFEPGQAYEIKYAYKADSDDTEYSCQSISTFSTLGKLDDEDFFLLDKIEYPFFLFEPAYGSLRAEQNIKACEEIIAANSPTLTKWAEFYLYMREFQEFAKKTRDNTIPYEQKMELYYAAKDKYFEFQASCASAYIQEVLKQRFMYSWVY
jgi:hypothetical protein